MSVARRASDTLFSPSPAGPPPGSGHYFLRRLSKFFLTFARFFTKPAETAVPGAVPAERGASIPMVRRTVCGICRDEFIGKRFDTGGEIE